MIFQLAEDFADALAAIPPYHAKRRSLELLEEAIRRDIQFIDRHPTTLFQCMWNDAVPGDSYESGSASEDEPSADRNSQIDLLVRGWGSAKNERTPKFAWVRTRSPLPVPLGVPINQTFRDASEPIHSLCYSPDGMQIAASSGNRLHIWEFDSNRERLSKESPHPREFDVVQFRRDGKYVLTWSRAGVALLDASNGETHSVFALKETRIYSPVFTRDHQYVVMGTSDDHIYFWKPGERSYARLDVTVTPKRLCYSHDGSILLVGNGNTWEARDSESWSCCWQRSFGCEIAHVFSHPENAFVGATKDMDVEPKQSVVVFDAKTGETLRTWEVSDVRFWSADISPGGKRMATADDITGRIDIWDVDTAARITAMPSFGWRPSTLAFAPSSRYLAFGAGAQFLDHVDCAVREWDTARTVPPASLYSETGFENRIVALRFLSGVPKIAILRYSGIVELWQTGDPIRRQVFNAMEKATGTVAIDPEGRWFAYANFDGRVCVADVAAPHEARDIAVDEGHPTLLYFSPDGERLLVGNRDGVIKLFNCGSWQPCGQLGLLSDGNTPRLPVIFNEKTDRIHQGSIRQIQILEDKLLYCTDGLYIHVWDLEALRHLEAYPCFEIQEISKPTAVPAVTSFCISPKRQLLIAGSSDGQIRIWNLANGGLVSHFTCRTRHLETITLDEEGRLLFITGKRFVAGGESIDIDKTLVAPLQIECWDLHEETPRCVQFVDGCIDIHALTRKMSTQSSGSGSAPAHALSNRRETVIRNAETVAIGWYPVAGDGVIESPDEDLWACYHGADPCLFGLEYGVPVNVEPAAAP